MLTNDLIILSGKIRDWLFIFFDDGVLRWIGVVDWFFILRKGFVDKIFYEINMLCIFLLEIEFFDIFFFRVCGFDDWVLWVGVGVIEYIEFGGVCCCGGFCCCVGGFCCCGVGISCCCCGGGVCGGEICGVRGSGGGGGGKFEFEFVFKFFFCIIGVIW